MQRKCLFLLCLAVLGVALSGCDASQVMSKIKEVLPQAESILGQISPKAAKVVSSISSGLAQAEPLINGLIALESKSSSAKSIPLGGTESGFSTK